MSALPPHLVSEQKATMINPETLRREFIDRLGAEPEHIVRAPGRVNLIGEHTDYNGGFVLPMAIDREALIAGRRRADNTVRMIALDFGGDQSVFPLDAIARDENHAWSNYVRGVALALQERGAVLTGLDMVIQGDVPIGSGLSSSAALEVCAAKTFDTFSALGLSGVDIAQLSQHAENQFVGVQSGIMDQFISALAQAGHALLIDCRDLSHRNVAMPKGITVVICDTMKRRGLVSSEYNTRRAECEQAVRLLAGRLGRPIRFLREVSLDEFTPLERELPPQVAKRARHVIGENARVLAAVTAMEKDDLVTLGRLMNESHKSLRNDYEVSCLELDAMVDTARHQPGCQGARLTGAGFGGCTVNLVRDNAVSAFVEGVARGYQAHTGIQPQIYVSRAAAGASVIQ